MNNFRLVSVALALVLFSSAACSKKSPPPVVGDIQRQEGGEAPTVNGGPIPRITAKITINKDSLFNREFLYGADLQYSTHADGELSLMLQSLALGHVPAKFRISGDELQLVADNRRLSPSDVNHPEQVVSRFRILEQTAKTLTVSGADSGAYLAEVYESMVGDGTQMANPAAKPLKDHWIRSLEFVAQGDYLLQETSVITADGTIAEFMESIFPKSDLAPSSGFVPVKMDPNAAPGTEDGIAGRFRFLSGESTFEGEQAVAYAQHFDIGSGATIDWYVTPNVPDEDLEPIRAGVEGWNRYFSRYKGIERDVMRFRGRLPEGIRIGDPRFNVINWDNRTVAGAAYESQAADPTTGRQSHSLIYLPAAWTKIGKDYWTSGVYSDPSSRSERTSRYGKYTACLRDLHDARSTVFSGLFGSQEEIAAFSRSLLAQTLFHEVGHALGLAHNFKGSLSYDKSKPGSIFSTSIMDYNEFAIERGAFTDLAKAEGPQLEYDRQAISALYNQSVDILPDQAVVPACNDAEADNEEGGVDPLCIRYDLQADPSRSVETAWTRIVSAESGETDSVSLSQAISKVGRLVLTQDELAKASSKESFDALTKKLAGAYKNTIRYFIAGGPGSLAKSVRTDMKILYTYEDDILPAGYDATQMRARLYDGLGRILGLSDLPDAPKAALDAAKAEALVKLKATPYFSGLSSTDATATAQSATEALDGILSWLKTDSTNGLPAIRAAVLATLTAHPAPFFLGQAAGQRLDYEGSIIGILADTAKNAAGTSAERAAAAKSLASFKDRFAAAQAIAVVRASLEAERAAAATNAQRELAEKLSKILSGQQPSAGLLKS